MDHGQRSMVADKFPWVFSEARLNACGKDARFGRRQRTSTPFRLGLALTATCASPRVATLADFHRGCHALCATPTPYKAFSNPVAQPHLATFVGTLASRLSGEMTLTGRGFAKGRGCAAFRHLVMQEGSSCAIHDAWREVCPGRFTLVEPAAVALHPTMDWRCDAPTTVGLTPDTASAQPFWPAPAALRDSLLWAERGSIAVGYRQRVGQHGGFFIIRAKAGMHPQGVEALREEGRRLRSLRHQPLQAIQATRPKRQRVALVVEWQVEKQPFRLRLLIRWHRPTKDCCSWRSHLPAPRSHRDLI
jgi:hypothetical protein